MTTIALKRQRLFDLFVADNAPGNKQITDAKRFRR